jgi:hypothetical protein
MRLFAVAVAPRRRLGAILYTLRRRRPQRAGLAFGIRAEQAFHQLFQGGKIEHGAGVCALGPAQPRQCRHDGGLGHDDQPA